LSTPEKRYAFVHCKKFRIETLSSPYRKREETANFFLRMRRTFERIRVPMKARVLLIGHHADIDSPAA
jgi:hypothetical protein